MKKRPKKRSFRLNLTRPESSLDRLGNGGLLASLALSRKIALGLILGDGCAPLLFPFNDLGSLASEPQPEMKRKRSIAGSASINHASFGMLR